MNQDSATPSSRNPGHQGLGVPTLKSLMRDYRAGARALKYDGIKTAIHKFTATTVNALHFLPPKLGQGVRCPFCNYQGKAFISRGNEQAVSYQSACPNCDSRSRHRGLFHLLPNFLDRGPDEEILVFAPEKILINHIHQITQAQIKTTDYNSTDVDFPGEDIQNLRFEDNRFACIICNHVLEHVPEDQKALHELARITKPGGVVLITIPGDFPKRETVHYDHPDKNGHFRHYGMEVTSLMENAFPKVRAVDMGKEVQANQKVRPADMLFICEK